MTERSSRRGAIDLARIGALVLVVLGHLSMAVIDRGPDGELRGDNVLSLYPALAWVAMLAPMPVFFAAGGWANATSEPVAAASRVRRLVGLAAVVVALWWAAAAVEMLALGSRGVVNDGARLATQPFWFLAAYVPFAVGGSAMAGLARRPVLVIGAGLAMLALLDAVRFAFGGPEWVGWTGFLLAWGVPWVLGAAWRRLAEAGKIDARSERRCGLILAASASAGAFGLVLLAGYHPSLIDAVPGQRSNTSPPTLFTAVAGMVQVGLLMAVAAPLDRWATRWRHHLARAGEASVAVYSWHLTALVLCAVPLAAGWWMPRRFDPTWWLTRPLWFAVVIGATLLFVLATEVVRQRLPRREHRRPATARVVVGAVSAAIGAAAVGRWGPRGPVAATVSLLGLALGTWLLGGAWRAPTGHPRTVPSLPAAGAEQTMRGGSNPRGGIMQRRPIISLLAIAILLLGACNTSTDESTTTADLTTSPEFVNRLIPGHRPLGLVGVGGTGGDFHLAGTASIPGVTVSFVPAEVNAGAVTEVWVDLPPTSEEVPFQVAVAEAGRTSTATFDATLVPGEDDLADTATQVAGLFLERIGDDVPDLPASAAELPAGTPVAGLLVVSHYAWFTDTYEIGVAWHIMVAPDDFAELYLRPRGSLVPSRAYRIDSWSTALAGGDVTLTEVDPPAEVTR